MDVRRRQERGRMLERENVSWKGGKWNRRKTFSKRPV
jgi:hypothetical protein